MNDTWTSFFLNEIKKDNIRKLVKQVSFDYENYTIFPPKSNILQAFKLCEYNKVRCVIVGQDPYHEINQANGLAFSTNSSKLPPSLVNIFKEYCSDLNYEFPSSGDLSKWAKEGVLLINSILSVKQGEAFSCNYKEYQDLFFDIIKFLNKSTNKIVFILWGNSALKCKKYINSNYHKIIYSAHPSPLSCYRGFFGSKPFTKTNEFLISNEIKPIDWKL